ncbi:UDP-Glycosyltransferase/glycogen phosphorylase [Trichodelitschia bisporula]|uniref:UDP-Glycosyltransferase/glycogen phosphorylase n=1 Tax=Trichodelitschia bisporula TaxID=703511 RepID=A0A6G1I0L3_9PEZI|nr:UDP-Glycosyltransferase/glycogen phosphorylase [Trichodelitschia bisporula]
MARTTPPNSNAKATAPSTGSVPGNNGTGSSAAEEWDMMDDFQKQKTPSFTVDKKSAPSPRPSTAKSADSYYGYNSGIDEASFNDEQNANDVPPPAYSANLGAIHDENDDMGTNASIADDGRVNIRINQKTHRVSNLLVPALRNQPKRLAATEQPLPPPYIPVSLGGSPDGPPAPPLNVVIHVVGSRGDVQPFVALGKVLKETYGHRVRLATHPVFRDFVTESGLEFFSIGGDPAELMAFMVKNPGLMPGFDSLRNGDVGKRRKGIQEMIKGCWRSCIEAGDGTGIEASDKNIEDWMNSDNPASRPFVADAIIANPPSFAHIHCAERLGVPLHMMFTMPWSPTQSFPHPLANIQSTNADVSMTNYISYALVDMLTWQGLGDIINRFRVHNLGLDPLNSMWAPGLVHRMRIPYTYCWSPALIPKPKDWGNHISIAGFYFLNLASNFTPPADLQAFLNAGPPPVYIGFGSIVIDDPNGMTKLIFDAVRRTGQRALVSKGWGGFGADQLGIPEGVFMLGNIPHDWLFQHVSCVVHHGGAGTTAAGISAGKPTVVVPFFGDQPFWGSMVARAGAGPQPIPSKELTAEKLAAAIMEALKPSSLEKAKELSAKISQEQGADKGALDFHQMLGVDKMRCMILPDRVAVWRVKRTQIRLSALAAYILAEKEVVGFSDLKLYRPREYDTEDGPTDPITGGAVAITGTLTGVMMGFADFPVSTLKLLSIYPDAEKRAEREKAKEDKAKGKAPETATPSSTSATLTASPASSQLSLPSTHRSNSIPHKPTPGQPTPLTHESTTSTTPTSESLSPPPRRSLGEALRSLSPTHSRSPSPASHHRREHLRQVSDSLIPDNDTTLDAALGTGKGLSRIVGAGLKSPMDLMLGISKGFHNVPRLYGEEVRPATRVTGMKSGLAAAGREFGLGVFDGITGLVTQPLKGAKEEGAAGFIKGMGRGMAGVVAKTSAGGFALPAYAMKGVYKAVQQALGPSVEGYIVAARTAQGWEEFVGVDAGVKAEVVRAYLEVLAEAKKGGHRVGEKEVEALTQWVDMRRADWGRGGCVLHRLRPEGLVKKCEACGLGGGGGKREPKAERGLDQAREMAATVPSSSNDTFNAAPAEYDDEDAALARALHESLLHQSTPSHEVPPVPSRSPMRGPTGAPPAEEEGDEEWTAALEASRAEEEAREKERREEEIVLEYVKKQSLREEELRRQRGGGGGA